MIIENMPFPEYFSIDHASAHRLWSILKSPMKMRHDVLYPRPPSDPMKEGTLFHALVAGEENILVRPSSANKKSNEGKKNLVKFLESATRHQAPYPPESCRTPSARLDYQINALQKILDLSSIQVYTADQMDTAKRMLDHLMRKPIARTLFETGRSEVTCLQRDPETKLHLKARLDWLRNGYEAIVDIKKTRDASHANFGRDAAKYGYPLQMSFYQWVYALETNSWIPVYIVAVESDPPFDSVIYEIDDGILDYGRTQYMRALEIYAECSRTEIWPGYDWNWAQNEHAIQTLTLPKWAYEDRNE